MYSSDPHDFLHNSSSTTESRLVSAESSNGGVEQSIYNDIVEIFPLVQSLIERKASSSFTRRGSIVYTKTPSKQSKKITESKGRNGTRPIPGMDKRAFEDKDQRKAGNINQDHDSIADFSSRSSGVEKDSEELVVLREQVTDLRQKLSDKEELLKSAELSKQELAAVHAKLDELKFQAVEKDTALKSVQRQLSDAKIKLADRQAVVEKLQWEATQSKQKAEKLQKKVDSTNGEVSSYMQLFEGLVQNSSSYANDDDFVPYQFDNFPYADDLDGRDIQELEEATDAYVTAVAMAKEKEDEESIAIAANARLHLISLLKANDNLVLDL